MRASNLKQFSNSIYCLTWSCAWSKHRSDVVYFDIDASLICELPCVVLPALQAAPKSDHVKRKLAKRQTDRVLDPLLDEQVASGRFIACISSRPGQVKSHNVATVQYPTSKGRCCCLVLFFFRGVHL